MIVRNYVQKQCYFDSVFLMRLSRQLNDLEGISQLSAGMGTPLNLATLTELNLLASEGRQAGPNDLIIAVAAVDQRAADRAHAEFQRLLTAKSDNRQLYQDLDTLCLDRRDLNLAVISVAGEFAAAAARDSLAHGLNVFMFSDGVSLAEEADLKQLAEEKGLMMMGPGCGLSFLNGLAIGLCSKVRRGNIGIVAASGSGMQEVMTLIHRHGMGISQAIGTGGRDLNEAVGGITMLHGLRVLAADGQTDVIVLISKPPAPSSARRILDAVHACRKPVVIQFINGEDSLIKASGAISASTFAETAFHAMALAAGKPWQPQSVQPAEAGLQRLAVREAKKMAPSQRYLRGIYCGGSLAEEALSLIGKAIGPVYANIAFTPEMNLDNPFESRQNTILDIGDEVFTRGRPHVAIDPTIRLSRFVREARDPETAVILLDFLLGYALHEDPAGVLAATIHEEILRAERAGRHLCVAASVCGSDLDPQDYQAQRRKLQDAGAIVLDNNGIMARFTAMIIKNRMEDESVG